MVREGRGLLYVSERAGQDRSANGTGLLMRRNGVEFEGIDVTRRVSCVLWPVALALLLSARTLDDCVRVCAVCVRTRYASSRDRSRPGPHGESRVESRETRLPRSPPDPSVS